MSPLSILTLAEHWLHRRLAAGARDCMYSSADLCLKDARRLWHEGQIAECKRRALRSLAYSVGICHPDYISASKTVV